MPYYANLKWDFRDEAERARVADRLLSLRASLDRNIPAKDLDENLLLATWNIRDFAKKNRRGFGERTPESHYYIAEILSRFDFVAVQEVNELDEWEKVMSILGRNYDYLATDVSDTSLGGNGERLLYLWDRRKVWHQNIAGEVVLPAHMEITSATNEVTRQFRRSPFVASFQSGWFKFDICTVHIYYGSDYGDKMDQRVQEIAAVAEYFGERADLHLEAAGEKDDPRATILLGDFNIVSPEHKTMEALLDQGFEVPKALRRTTNTAGTKHYDQIAFKTKDEVLDYIERDAEDPTDSNAGAYDFFRVIFRKSHVADYHAAMQESSNHDSDDYDDLDDYFETWRTYQMSDHKPLWVRLKVNESDAYLERIAEAAGD